MDPKIQKFPGGGGGGGGGGMPPDPPIWYKNSLPPHFSVAVSTPAYRVEPPIVDPSEMLDQDTTCIH